MPAWHRGGWQGKELEACVGRTANTHSPDACKDGRRAKVLPLEKQRFVRSLLHCGTERPQRASRLLSGDLEAKPVSHPAPPALQGLGRGHDGVTLRRRV